MTKLKVWDYCPRRFAQKIQDKNSSQRRSNWKWNSKRRQADCFSFNMRCTSVRLCRRSNRRRCTPRLLNKTIQVRSNVPGFRNTVSRGKSHKRFPSATRRLDKPGVATGGVWTPICLIGAGTASVISIARLRNHRDFPATIFNSTAA